MGQSISFRKTKRPVTVRVSLAQESPAVISVQDPGLLTGAMGSGNDSGLTDTRTPGSTEEAAARKCDEVQTSQRRALLHQLTVAPATQQLFLTPRSWPRTPNISSPASSSAGHIHKEPHRLSGAPRAPRGAPPTAGKAGRFGRSAPGSLCRHSDAWRRTEDRPPNAHR